MHLTSGLGASSFHAGTSISSGLVISRSKREPKTFHDTASQWGKEATHRSTPSLLVAGTATYTLVLSRKQRRRFLSHQRCNVGLLSFIPSNDGDELVQIIGTASNELSKEQLTEIFDTIGDTPQLLTHFDELLLRCHERGFDVSNAISATLVSLLKAGSPPSAAARVLRCLHNLPETEGTISFREDVHRRLIYTLVLHGELDLAITHLKFFLCNDTPLQEVALLYNTALVAALRTTDKDSIDAAEKLINIMISANVTPNVMSLQLLVDAHMRTGSPNFMREIGMVVARYEREFGVRPDEYVSMALARATLRSGDTMTSYFWFLASQSFESPAPLALEPDAITPSFISELLRALAVGGYAMQVLHVLKRVAGAGGRLPPSASSVSVAGYTCGRTLATVWLEPAAEVNRRRSIWSSETEKMGNQARSKGTTIEIQCAEQMDWRLFERSRHEAYQWSPYLSPDAKLERAWLMPLRAQDADALGLKRDWLGEGPAVMAARERLTDPSTTQRDMQTLRTSLALSLRLDPPKPQSKQSMRVPAFILPTPRTWRCRHALTLKLQEMSPKLLQVSSQLRLSEETADAVALEVQQQIADDKLIGGDACDELRLAVDVITVFKQLGGRLSAADVQALCAAAHAADDPDIATSVLKAVSHDVLLDDLPGRVPGTGEAMDALTEAMVKGGWGRASVEEFLLGERPLPVRDGVTALGKLSTRFFDPLMGYTDDPLENRSATRAQILTALTSSHETMPKNQDSIEFAEKVSEENPRC